MGPSPGPQSRSPHNSRHPTVLTPLRLRAAPRAVECSRRLHHLPLQLLERVVGVRPHTREDLGRAGTGCRGSGEGRSGGRGGVAGGEGRHLQDSALLLEAGPGLIHPPCALTRGEPWLDGVGGTRPSPPFCTCPATRTPQAGPPETPALPHLPQGLRLHGVLGLHQLQLFLPENPGKVALDPALPPRPRPKPRPIAPPEHLQGRQLRPELLLRPLLAQLLSSVVEELGVGLVTASSGAY